MNGREKSANIEKLEAALAKTEGAPKVKVILIGNNDKQNAFVEGSGYIDISKSVWHSGKFYIHTSSLNTTRAKLIAAEKNVCSAWLIPYHPELEYTNEEIDLMNIDNADAFIYLEGTCINVINAFEQYREKCRQNNKQYNCVAIDFAAIGISPEKCLEKIPDMQSENMKIYKNLNQKLSFVIARTFLDDESLFASLPTELKLNICTTFYNMSNSHHFFSVPAKKGMALIQNDIDENNLDVDYACIFPCILQ